MRFALCSAAVLLTAASCATTQAASGPSASSPREEVRRVAERYLEAVVGKGDEADRELLLGGATTDGRLFTLENWRIVEEQEPRHEEAEVEAALQSMQELDEASRAAVATIVSGSGASEEEASVEQLTPEVAAELMKPTQASADRFTAALPLLAEVLRVGEAVYWAPRNPARAMLSGAGGGRYALDLYGLTIESIEGPRKVPRRWPLRVLRFKTAALDTGWRVLPASDWNAE